MTVYPDIYSVIPSPKPVTVLMGRGTVLENCTHGILMVNPKQFLHLFVNQRQDDWYNWFLIAEFAYNDWVHTSTQTSPFMLDAGQNPQLGFEPVHES